MSANLYYASIDDEGALRTLLESAAPHLPYAYVEGEIDIALAWTADVIGTGVKPTYRPNYPELAMQPIPLAAWSHGRIFGPEAEIRWEKARQGYSLSLLTENDNWGEGWNPSGISFDEPPQARDVMLLGVRTEELPVNHALHNQKSNVPVWVETRYPRPLTYPVDFQNESVYLYCWDYSVRAVVVMTRLYGIGRANHD